jgi:hypothetical protein
MTASTRYKQLLDDAWDLHVRKNAGYAGDDPDPFANFRMSEKLGIPAWQGSLVRLGDKFIRVNNLTKNPNLDQVNESLVDTLSDLAAYALITICLLEEAQGR